MRDTLIGFLNSDSYRNTLANAAIAAFRAQNDPTCLGALQSVLKEREPQFTSLGLARGLETLGYLARNEEKKDTVRDFLLSYLQHRKRTVQLAAINALGALGDPRAIAVLETFTSAQKESPQRKAAEKAVALLGAAKKPSDEWRDLRNEVLELKKSNRELSQQLQDLKKKVEAAPALPADSGRRKSTGKGR